MKPMLFSTPMVEAIMNTKPDAWPAEPVDRAKPFKWQTRRVIKPQPDWPEGRYRYDGLLDGTPAVELLDGDRPTERYIRCPKPLCEEGDIIWVRETFSGDGKTEDTALSYKADPASEPTEGKWKPSIHMPREAARLFLEVKAVRVERLQDITEADMDAEGVAVMCFSWDRLAAKSRSPHTWDSNPWVFVYEFMPTKNEKEIKND